MSSPKMKQNDIANSPRAFAINLIVQCNKGSYANDLVPDALSKSNFSNQDKSLITKIVYSTLRNQIRIDNALSKVSKKPIEKLDDIAIGALRSIVAQLCDGLAPHAVINETVKVMPLSLKGFVNGVARKLVSLFENNKLFVDEAPHIKYSLPKWVHEEIETVFENADDVACALNVPAQTTIRVFSDVSDETVEDIAGDIIKEATLVSSQGDIGELNVIKDGNAIVLDQGSQVVVQCLDPQEDDVVLDLCAAPGGKSFLISKIASKVVSADVSFSRMKKFIQTKNRISANNVYPIVANGTKIPLKNSFKI